MYRDFGDAGISKSIKGEFYGLRVVIGKERGDCYIILQVVGSGGWSVGNKGGFPVPSY